MQLQQLYSKVRQAIQDYNMIQEGDRIALGVSGGKDSLALLYALAGLRQFYPKSFELTAITVDLGYEGFDLSAITSLCRTLQVEYVIVKTNIGKMIEKEGCSLCAKLRKGALHEKALELHCNKIAYAHNMDDIIETMMLSLIYEGHFATIPPVKEFSDSGLTLIRPLIYVTQAQANGFKNKYDLPVTSNPCPFDKTSERAYVRNLLKDIEKHAPGARKSMMHAIQSGILSD